MKMKQISAGSMQEAMSMARRELGENAVLLESKKISGGGISVTFAVEDAEEAPMFYEHAFDDPTDNQPFPREIPRAVTAKVELEHPALQMIAEALRHHHVPLSLSEKILLRAHQIRLQPDALIDTAERALAEALESVLMFKPIATGASVPPQRAIMLVGAHGAGKTSAIAKLATELTLHKQRVVLISCDNERMGAADTLHGLADILKCNFHIAEDRATLKALLKQYIGQAWVLIDTTGVNIYEFKQLKHLGELGTLQGIETILTCPAGIDADEAQEMAGVLGFLDIERMIVTRTDAARRLSSVFAALAAGGLALSNMSSAAQPAKACTPMSAAGLARLMLRDTREKLTH